MKNLLLSLLIGGILVVSVPVTAYAESVDFVAQGGIIPSVGDLDPSFAPNTTTLGSLSLTEDDLILAAEDTTLQGLLNTGRTVPSYYLYYVQDAYTFVGSLPLKGKVILYVNVDISLDPPDIVYRLNDRTSRWWSYTSRLKHLAYVLHDGKFMPVSDYYDLLGDSKYGSFVTAVSNLNANYPIKNNISNPSMYVQMISANVVSIQDADSDVYPAYSYRRLLKFEATVFKNEEPSEGSEVYNMYVWTLALLLLYHTIGKPTLAFFSFKERGVNSDV